MISGWRVINLNQLTSNIVGHIFSRQWFGNVFNGESKSVVIEQVAVMPVQDFCDEMGWKGMR